MCVCVSHASLTPLLGSMHNRNRDVSRAHFDGDRYTHFFGDEHVITVRASPYPLYTVNATSADWLRDINHQLMWNAELSKQKLVH